VPFFFVCDHRAIRRYGLGFAKPSPVPLSPYLRTGYVIRGATLEELAVKAGINPSNLRDTVKEFNEYARVGVEPRFGNGSNVMNRFRGDEKHSPNPCMAPLDRPPFYALKAYPGVGGSFLGLKTNRYAQVLAKGGHPIPGLYAAGNDMANVFSGTCPGAGPNLAPAMTFGYIAGCNLAGVQD
jgi:succinate dehydrogenase/fumarate reductase flavoprotein subunit